MLIVALYMNDVPVPSAQVIVRNAQWTFLLGWNLIAVRSLITQCIHNPTPCGFIWASLTTSSKEISTYGSFFKSLKSQVSVTSLLIPPSFPPLRSQSSVPWERGCGISGSPDIGDLGKKGRTCRWTLPPGVPGKLVSLESTNHLVQCYYLPWYLHLFLDKPAHVPCSLTTRSWRA